MTNNCQHPHAVTWHDLSQYERWELLDIRKGLFDDTDYNDNPKFVSLGWVTRDESNHPILTANGETVYQQSEQPTPPPAVDADALAALVESCEPFMETWQRWLDSDDYTSNEEPFIDWLQATCDSELLQANWQQLAEAAALAKVKGE